MTDINQDSKIEKANMPFSGEIEHGRTSEQNRILTLMELLYFAYRDFTSDCDEILLSFNFGRAHHRVIHFVNRYPGLRVADLLNILKITKQSLARVLKQLIEEEYIYQEAGEKDRRERHLHVTERGRELAVRLATPQIEHISRAIGQIDTKDSELIEDFLYALVQEPNRHDVITLIAENTPSLLKQLKSHEGSKQSTHE